MIIYSFIYQKFKNFSDRVDFELKIFKCDQKSWENFKRKVSDNQIRLKLKLKVKLTFGLFVDDYKWKICQKQFKSQNIYIFFNHFA
jgi:hypothetical protein